MANVTVQFSGLAVARTKKNEVYLPDMSSMGGPAHCAVLLVRDHSGLRGIPDFVVAEPFTKNTQSPSEYAGWFLRGEVSITGAMAGFSTDVSETLDLERVTGARKLKAAPLRPTTATVRLDNGKLSSIGEPHLFNFEYGKNTPKDQVYPKPIQLRDRLSFDLGDCTGMGAVVITMENGGQRRIVTINPATVEAPLVISNTSAGAPSNGHFRSVFMLLDQPQRDVEAVRYMADGVTRAPKDPPDHTDECYTPYISE